MNKKIKDYKKERKIKECRQAVLGAVISLAVLLILVMTGVIGPCDFDPMGLY